MRVIRTFIVTSGALAAIAAALPAYAQNNRPDELLMRTASSYTACLTATVKMGMATKMNPAIFKEGFAKSCMPQETAFRVEAVKAFMNAGKTATEAQAEVDNNIANGRRIFAADQERYVVTGKMPNQD